MMNSILKEELLYQLFSNYKTIKPGKYYGQIQTVFAEKNRKGEDVICFIIEYYDVNEEIIKAVISKYNVAGPSRTYLLTQLIPILKYYGIEIGFTVDNEELLRDCCKLIGKALPFYVEETEYNKNIRLICPTYQLKSTYIN